MTEEPGWGLIAAERRALADRLEGLGPTQWAMPSLCEGWTVKDVATHLMIGPTGSVPEFLVAFARARGNLHRANQLLVTRRRGMSTAEVVAALRDHAESRFSPPGLDWRSPLTDVLLHREDIAVPLGGFPRTPHPWSVALSFLLTPKARKVFVRPGLPDLTFAADDLDWSHGNGPEVAGPAAALGAAIAGRAALLDRLRGPGVPALRAWLAA